MKAPLLPTLGCLALITWAPISRASADTRGIVIDPEGRTIYYADDQHRAGSVWKVDVDGRSRPTIVAYGRHTTDLFLGRDGVCYGLDIGREFRSARLWAVGSEKDALWFVPPAAREGGRAAWGWGQFVLDDAGQVYFAYDHGVWVCGPDRRARKLAGGLKGETDGRDRSAGFGAIGGMAWGLDGFLYVVDDGDLRRVSRAGDVSTFARGLLDPEPGDGGRLCTPYYLGLTVDWRGNFFFTDDANQRVRKVSTAGRVLTVDHGDTFWRPTGVAVHRDTLFILEYTGPCRSCYAGKVPRVRKVDPDGRSTVLATFGEPVFDSPVKPPLFLRPAR